SSRRRHTRSKRDWSSDVCSSDLIKSKQASHEFSREMKATTQGQYPYASILSCIDSRVPAEIVFDQGIGDLFSTRIAGNVISNDRSEERRVGKEGRDRRSE